MATRSHKRMQLCNGIGPLLSSCFYNHFFYHCAGSVPSEAASGPNPKPPQTDYVSFCNAPGTLSVD